MTPLRWGRVTVLAAVLAAGLSAGNPGLRAGAASIETGALKTWLTYIAADELQGREIQSEGHGLAAAYIARHLAEWGVKPAAEDGSYFQHVKLSAAGRLAPPRFALVAAQAPQDAQRGSRTPGQQVSRNVVGLVEGTDPMLKDTYVAFGAHYDHIGHHKVLGSDGLVDGHPGGCVGQTRPQPRPDDVVNNGADDDGSGTVALMAIARAFAQGPRPKRSLLFVWHTAEEAGLLGSRHNAEYPVVPNDRIIAHLNVDMIGRNRCDQSGESNTVYLIGSDRISTELHNISEDANASLGRPMRLDYELNDPLDPLALYTRSDHYSYAAKGIPVIFYTTGLHRDYHFLTDETDKIEWEKLRRITELVYTTGQRLANLERAPVRDNKGPRAGRGGGGKLR